MRAGLLLDAYQQRRELAWLQFRHRMLYDVLLHGDDIENRDEVRKQEEAVMWRIREILLDLPQPDPTKMARSFTAAWETNYGKLDDPQVAASLDTVVAALKATRQQNALRSAQS